MQLEAARSRLGTSLSGGRVNLTLLKGAGAKCALVKLEEELSPVCLRLGKDSSSNLISHLNSEFGGPAPNYSPSATKGQQHHSNALCQSGLTLCVDRG